jgi:hypothetical protein
MKSHSAILLLISLITLCSLVLSSHWFPSCGTGMSFPSLSFKFTDDISETAASLAALRDFTQLSTAPLLWAFLLNFVAPAKAQATTYELVCDSGEASFKYYF